MQNRRPRKRPNGIRALTTVEIGVLIAVVRLEGLGYGLAIHNEFEGFFGKPISTAAVYLTLKRFERCGLLRTTVSAPLRMPGGRSKRLYELTSPGRTVLKGEQIEAARLWQALPRSFRERA